MEPVNSRITSIFYDVAERQEDLLAKVNEASRILQEDIVTGEINCFKWTCLSGRGEFTVTERALVDISPEVFWCGIEKMGIKRFVVIPDEGTNLIYTRPVLNQLLYVKPLLEDLTKRCTLTFAGGETLTLPRATLRLCGDSFSGHFEVSLSKNEITFRDLRLESFLEILTCVEEGRVVPESSSEEFTYAVDFLGFPPKSFMLPEGVIGQKELETYLGKVDPVLPPPRELLEAIQSGEITKETHIVQWIPPRVDGEPLTLNRLEQLIRSKNSIGFEKDWCDIPETIGNQLMYGGYWLVMQKNLIQGTANMTYEQADDFVTQNFPGYEMLDTGDVALSIFMNNLCSEKKEHILDRQDPVRYTWCNGLDQTWHMIVGAFAPSGLRVNSSVDHDYVGLLVGRKFF